MKNQRALPFISVHVFKMDDLKKLGVEMFNSSLNSVFPELLVKSFIQRDRDFMIINNQQFHLSKNLNIVGFGKAVPGMMAGVEKILSDHIKHGIICVPYGSKDKLSLTSNVDILEGGKNNLPDDQAVANSLVVKRFVESLSREDILLVLISGGGSALLSLPVEQVGLKDKLATIKEITKAGGNIKDLNTVRKVLSQLKGGKLLEATTANTVVSLIISDIVGNPINYIASGPTVLDDSTPDQCFEIFQKLKIGNQIPESVINYLNSLKDRKGEYKRSYIKKLPNITNLIIGSNSIITKQLCEEATNLGFHTILLTNELTGESSVTGEVYANILYSLCNSDDDKITLSSKTGSDLYCPFLRNDICLNRNQNICLVSSGETTVTIKGNGKGGRNQEMALSFLSKLQRLYQQSSNFDDTFKFLFLSCGTDGQDGPTEANGGIVDSSLLSYVLKNKFNCSQFLLKNASNEFFNSCDFFKNYLHVTGLTGTNVMDVQILLVSY